MKIPAEFGPKSWEMPPSARVIEESASVVARNFTGRTLKWIVALVKVPQFAYPIVWTRPLDLNFDAGFVGFDYATRQWIPVCRHPEDLAAGAMLMNLWQNNQFARYFFCNESGDLRREGEPSQNSLLVAPLGSAAWAGRETHIANPIVFDWGTPMTNSEFLQISSLELWKRMQNDTSSELLGARQFANMDDEERHQSIWGSSCISEEKTELLLRTLITGQNFWMENPEVTSVSVDIYTGQEEIEISIEQGANYELMKITDELFEDAQLLANHFRPPSKPKIETNSYRGIWISGRSRDLQLDVSRPTAHEQLEAQLRWREWIENHEKI